MADESQERRQQIDPVFKQVLEDELSPFHAALQTEVEVSRLPRTIDALITIVEEDDLQEIHIQTPFFYFLRYNQVEFKGRRDALTSQGHHLIRGRTHLLLGEQELSPEEMTVTIICASKPQKVLANAQMLQQPFVPVEAGYYKRAGQPPVYLLVVNELPLIPKNYALLLFASSERKFRDFLEEVVKRGETAYLRYAYEVRPKTTKEVLTMAGISTTLSREDLEFMADDIGRELVAFLSPEERLAGLSIEDRLKGLTPKEQRILLDLLLKMQSSSSTDKEEPHGSGHTD